MQLPLQGYTLEDCTAEINTFLAKFEASLGADYEIITRL
jgi:hypothetical protein